MISGFSRGSAAVFLCAFGATAAQADVTAQDVWSDWRAYLSGTGYEVSATEQMSGDTLTVSDTTLKLDLPEEDVAITIGIGELSFTENSDGTVRVDLPSTLPVVIAGTDEAGDEFQATVNYDQTGFSMVASGEPDAMTYNYTASSMRVSLGEVVVNGSSMGDDFARADLTLMNVIGSTRVDGSDIRSYSQNMQAGDLRFQAAFTDPDEGGKFEWSGGTDALQMESVTALPPELDTQNMAAMIDAGFDADGSLNFGPGSSTLTYQDAAESFNYESTSNGGRFGFSMGEDGFGYSVKQSDVALNVTGSEVPLPVSMSFAEMVFDMMIPVMQSDEAHDFDLEVALGDFTMSDLLWGVFDPTGQLPRDPATIRLALKGTAKLLADVMDPMVAMQMENGPPPAELETLTLDNLKISAAGASLTGEGDFTFDNADTITFDGLPRPTGFVDLQLVGGNGLLDKLVAMGLLPQEQAGGARMMMGLFAVPGDAPDTLNSRIEINDQGHILANGQRIQ